MTSSTRDWAGLPEHILDMIVTKFSLLSDYFSFPAVCSNWRKLNPSSNNFLGTLKLSGKEIPMLMFKTEKHNDDSRGLYNVLNKMSYNIQLPIPYDFRFVGSSHGWLFCLDTNMVITILDPFSSVKITLPIFKDLSQVLRDEWHNVDLIDHYIQKAIFTSDPRTSPNNYEVVVIYQASSKLAYYKSGDQYWKFIDLRPEERYMSMDVIFHKSYIYSVTYHGELLQIDFHNGNAETIVPGNPVDHTNGFYLVESKDEDLLLIKRRWVPDEKDDDEKDDDLEVDKTFKFEVFELIHAINDEFATWHEIHDIGDQALFVGSANLSVSVSTLECSKFHRNSIYYSPQAYLDCPSKYMEIELDCGIFNLEDKSFHEMLGLSGKHVQPPVWFVPNLK